MQGLRAKSPSGKYESMAAVIIIITVLSLLSETVKASGSSCHSNPFCSSSVFPSAFRSIEGKFLTLILKSVLASLPKLPVLLHMHKIT